MSSWNAQDLIAAEQSRFAAGLVPADTGQDSELHDSPGRDARHGLIVAAAFFLGFGGFAAFVPLQSAVHAPAVLAVEGGHQTVQHAEGGIVSRLFVRENQRIRQGALLLELGGADVREEVTSLTNTAIALLAQRARLQAERDGQLSIQRPPEFARLDPDMRYAADRALAEQAALLIARQRTLTSEGQINTQRAAQLREQGSGAEVQMRATEEQLRLLREEIDALTPLIDRGFVSANRVRQLKRQEAALSGAIGEQRAAVARSREAIGETSLTSLNSEQAFRAQVAADYQATIVELGQIMPRLAAAQARQERLRLRAAKDGVVVGLSVINPGAVIAPGQKIMDIVPQPARHFVQAEISPAEVDDIRPGSEAEIKFSGLPSRNVPVLLGTVRAISADRFTNERNGEPYYKAEISVSPAELEKLTRASNLKGQLRPGMPLNIIIAVRERTLLSYLTEPLFSSLRRAFK
jgi:HlyD family secretion protein